MQPSSGHCDVVGLFVCMSHQARVAFSAFARIQSLALHTSLSVAVFLLHCLVVKNDCPYTTHSEMKINSAPLCNYDGMNFVSRISIYPICTFSVYLYLYPICIRYLNYTFLRVIICSPSSNNASQPMRICTHMSASTRGRCSCTTNGGDKPIKADVDVGCGSTIQMHHFEPSHCS